MLNLALFIKLLCAVSIILIFWFPALITPLFMTALVLYLAGDSIEDKVKKVRNGL